MSWEVAVVEEFAPEFEAFPLEVRKKVLALAEVLSQLGPTLGRPHVDTLTDSGYPNMKEMRFSVANGVWRLAFAFDPAKRAVLLVAGDKQGKNEGKFYDWLIRLADERFTAHLGRLKVRKKKGT